MGSLAQTSTYTYQLDSTLSTQSTCMLSSTLGVSIFNVGTDIYIESFNIYSNSIIYSANLYIIPSSGGGNIQNSSFSVCALSSTTFVVSYRYTSDYLYTIAGTISGNTITLGTAVNTSSSVASTVSFSITPMSSSSFIVAYCTSTTAYLIAGTVSTRTIVLGTAVTLASSSPDLPFIKSLSSTSFIASCVNSSGYILLKPGTLSNHTISLGTTNTTTLYCPGYYPVIEILSSTTFVVSSIDSSTGDIGVIVCSTDNSTVTVNSFQSIFTPSDISYPGGITLFPISSTLVGCVVSDVNTGFSKLTTISISGTSASINSGDTIELNVGTIPIGMLSTSFINSTVVTAGSQFIVADLESSTVNSLITYLITYTAPTGGKKRGGITISKWDSISPTKINGI